MNIKKYLAENVKPATGCTEPVAVAYAVAMAYSALKGVLPPDFGDITPPDNPDDIIEINVKTDRNVYKNALSITIPGTDGEKGMAVAAAMGVFLSPKKGLDLLSNVNETVLKNSRKILSENKIVIQAENADTFQLDINVKLTALVDGKPKTGTVRIQGRHDRVTRIAIEDKTVFSDESVFTKGSEEAIPQKIDSLLHLLDDIDDTVIETLFKGLDMNMETARLGLEHTYGLGLGRHLMTLTDKGILGKGVITDVRIMAAAAGDARMGGALTPVMSTAGSGNQGIAALIPIAVISNAGGISREKTAKAALFSHLITKYVGIYSGGLSALCGCAVKAGIGAAAGITYLLGGGIKEIHNVINIMAANITGIICDGAKEGCALKLSTAAGTAAESAYLAMDGLIVTGKNGMIFDDADQTIQSIGKVSNAMITTDQSVVNIMQSKNS